MYLSAKYVLSTLKEKKKKKKRVKQWTGHQLIVKTPWTTNKTTRKAQQSKKLHEVE
jgi:hypothetical protein